MSPEQLTSMIVTVSTIIVTIGVLFGVMVFNRKRNKFVTVSKEEAQNLPTYRCPKCGFNMSPGYTFTQRGLYWRKVNEKPIGRLMTSGKLQNNTYNLGFTPAENRAWKCERCQILTLDISELVQIK